MSEDAAIYIVMGLAAFAAGTAWLGFPIISLILIGLMLAVTFRAAKRDGGPDDDGWN